MSLCPTISYILVLLRAGMFDSHVKNHCKLTLKRNVSLWSRWMHSVTWMRSPRVLVWTQMWQTLMERSWRTTDPPCPWVTGPCEPASSHKYTSRKIIAKIDNNAETVNVIYTYIKQTNCEPRKLRILDRISQYLLLE